MSGLAIFLPDLFQCVGEGIGFRLCTNERLAKDVHELRTCISQRKCFWVAQGEVKPLPVHSFIARQATNITHLLHSRGEPKTFHFFVKVVSLCAKSYDKTLKANSEHRAGCSWRNIDDVLSLFKNAAHIVRHELGRNDPARGRIDKSFVVPEVKAAAVGAPRHKVCVRAVELLDSIAIGGSKRIKAFFNASGNGKSFNLRQHAAMRANKRFVVNFGGIV